MESREKQNEKLGRQMAHMREPFSIEMVIDFSCTNVCGTVRDKNSHQVDMKFVSEYLSTVAKNHVSYVGNPKLMNGIFGEIKFLSPPLPEQKKIASILTSVD